MSEDEKELTYTSKKNDLVRFSKKNKIRKRGRPKTVNLLPPDEKTRVKMKQKEKMMSKDNLMSQIQEDPDSLNVLDQVMYELAAENASLRYERKEAERTGKDTTQQSSKKVTTLKSIADVYFKKREAIIDQDFDFSSEKFNKLIDFFFRKVKTAAENANLSNEQIGVLYGKLGDLFDDESGWEKEAKNFIQKEG